ncbi:hypothetical protein [Streptomyces sp. NPDC059828]|uniref:hypothetical protein n=1 Tax=Streptomyces sp. NPDC059828 TaxID=3346965 RepID=UPI00365E1FF9
MAVTGFALLLAATRRARFMALAPVLAGAAVALLILPSDPRRAYVVDEAAAAQVCEGPVCVTRLHQARLAELAAPGKEALRLLRQTLGSQAPVSIREATTPRTTDDEVERSRTSVLVDFDDGAISTVKGEGPDQSPARPGTRAPLLPPHHGQQQRNAERNRRAEHRGGLGRR